MRQFADTYYFLALLNPNDEGHLAAMDRSSGTGQIITTEWVLIELADAMASKSKRSGFVELYRLLMSDPEVEIVQASSMLFTRAVEFFSARSDKDWSLTDCISFIVMKDRGIDDALTGDHHFEQAGFRALLRACHEITIAILFSGDE